MNSYKTLFGQIEQGLQSLELSKVPKSGEFSFWDFDKTACNGYIFRLGIQDVSYPSLWIGGNETLNAKQTIWESRGVRATQAQDFSGTTSSWIVIETEKLQSPSIFISLASSICAKCIDKKSTSKEVVSAALDEWREMFRYDSSGLGQHELAGLVGELITLEGIAALHGSDALETWHGPDRRCHDFSRGRQAIETKTKTSMGLEVSINGLSQLEPPADGMLILRFIRLEESSDGNLSIPSLIKQICAYGPSLRRLDVAILKAGASFSQLSEPHILFRLLESAAYCVTEGFPRIIPSSFNDMRCPDGVAGIKYRTDLALAEKHRINETEYLAFLKTF